MPKILAYGEDEQCTKWLMRILSNCGKSKEASEFVRKVTICLHDNICNYTASYNTMVELTDRYDVNILPSYIRLLNFTEAENLIKESNIVCLAMRGLPQEEPDRIKNQMGDIATKAAYINYIANGTPIFIFYFGQYSNGLQTPMIDNTFTNNFGDKIMINIKKAQDSLPTVQAVNDIYNYCPSISGLHIIEDIEQLHPQGITYFWNDIAKYLFPSFGHLRKVTCNHKINLN